MIDVELPPGPAAGALARGFAACLASVTEVPVTDLPRPGEDLAQALGAWRTWLAEHGSGLVPIADPVRFQWAGWWIAVVEDPPGPAADRQADGAEVAVLAFGTPPGVVLSPQAPALVGRAPGGGRCPRQDHLTGDDRVRAGATRAGVVAVAAVERVPPVSRCVGAGTAAAGMALPTV